MGMNASMIICDDLRMEVTGKLFLIGVYPGNIGIPVEGSIAGQLMFFFSFDCPIEDTPANITFEIILPGERPEQATVSVNRPEPDGKHTRWFMRQVIAVQGKTLRAGKILARVTADNAEVDISSPWIEIGPQMTFAPPRQDSTASPPPA